MTRRYLLPLLSAFSHTVKVPSSQSSNASASLLMPDHQFMGSVLLCHSSLSLSLSPSDSFPLPWLAFSFLLLRVAASSSTQSPSSSRRSQEANERGARKGANRRHTAFPVRTAPRSPTPLSLTLRPFLSFCPHPCSLSSLLSLSFLLPNFPPALQRLLTTLNCPYPPVAPDA